MKKLKKKAFTLVEIMVAVTIFSVVMVSVMGIYMVTTETTYKSEVNRIMHENVKNIVSNISEDVIKNGINGVSPSIGEDCSLPTENTTVQKKGFIFCTEDKENYYILAKKNGENFLNISNISECSQKNFSTNLYDDCFLVKKDSSGTYPITNSLVTVREANFIVTNDKTKKVTISLKLQPSQNSGIRKSLVEQNIFDFQTTLSERPYNVKN